MNTKSKKAEEIVRTYARALETLNLKLIYNLFHPEFKFVYRFGYSGHGIRTDVRYIGHLYKSFEAMKSENAAPIKTDFFYSVIDGEKILCIKLFPPHDRRIIYPMDFQLIEQVRTKILPETEVCMLPLVIKGLLCKIECYDSMRHFIGYVDETFNRISS